MSRTATYTVTGMTCGHCVASVTEEVLEVEGVEAASADLASGRLTVEGVAAPGAIGAAVEAAGYAVTTS